MSGIRPGRISGPRLDQLLSEARSAAPTYGHVGSTLVKGPAPGVADHTSSLEVDGSLADAVTTLRRWAAHEGIRARIHPADTSLIEGASGIVVAPFGPVELVVPVRIVVVVDTPDRFGFAYGTLPGHPESGEELFLAEVIGPGRLRLTVRVQALPATLLARLGGIAVRAVQRVAARRYLAAWVSAIEAKAAEAT